ncbi:MAG: sporulation protein YqfD [Acetatifactor sp.]|nr:sporulation protein YqfD [Acetatifactor sp.]
MIGILRYLRGYLRIRVWGFSPERFMNLCSNRDILLWDIVRDGDAYYMSISLSSFYKLRPIVKKTGTRVAILQRYGLPFFIPTLKHRKVFLVGSVLAVLFWVWSSLYIWDIDLEGNYQITEDAFNEFLMAENVRIGMQQSELNIEELEKAIRRKFPQVTWTSAKLSGTRLQIDIKENDAPITVEETKKAEGTNLVAEYNGIVVSMIVRSGIPMVAIGDTVEEGTVLVEGLVPIYNDDTTIREYQLVEADADIVIEHMRTETITLPFNYVKKKYTGRTRSRFFLRVGDKEWRMPMERPFLVYDSVIRQSRPLIFERLSIPAYWGSYTYREYQNVEYEYSLEEAETLLNENLTIFLSTLEEKGVQIIEKDVRIDTSGGEWMLYGEFLVQERVGRSVDTTIPDIGESETNE